MDSESSDSLEKYADRKARKEQKMAAKKERVLKNKEKSRQDSNTQAQNKHLGYMKVAEGVRDPQQLRGQLQKQDTAINTANAHDNPQAARPGPSGLFAPKTLSARYAARSATPDPSYRLTVSDRDEQLKILRQSHTKTVPMYEKYPRTENRRESQGYNQRPTGTFEKSERASTAPRRVQGEPPLEQKHPYDEIKDPIGRQYRGYKIAEQEYREAAAEYKKKRQELKLGEDPSYRRYGGRHPLKLTPPTHQA